MSLPIFAVSALLAITAAVPTPIFGHHDYLPASADDPPGQLMVPGPAPGPYEGRSGTVVAVDKFTLTLKLKRTGEKTTYTTTPEVRGWVRPPFPFEMQGYYLSDLKVGDVVDVTYQARGKELLCSRIMIHRRPGGKIPELPADRERPKDGRPPSRNPWHERVQSYQDWEEMGIPIPDRYLPPGELSVPFPDVAPKPREVKPQTKP